MRRGDGAVDKQCFRGAADAGAAQLCVAHDGSGHVEIGGAIDIDVHDAFEMREDRHARFVLHARHEALATPRHDDVEITLQAFQQFADGGAVAHRHALDGGFGQVGGAQALDEASMNRGRRME